MTIVMHGRTRNGRPHGVALGTVLICFLALITILFAAAAGSVSHLGVAQSLENQQHAKNLAESAITTAITDIAATGTPPSDIDLTFQGVDGHGILTFNKPSC